MSMVFSRRCEYAIQAILFLAGRENGTMVSIRDFTNRLGIPYHYLAKILQDLTRRKILKSHRGAKGGYALARNPEDITLIRVVEAVDGEAVLKSCVLGFAECSNLKPCSLHEQWADSRERIRVLLETENIAGLAARMQRPEYGR